MLTHYDPVSFITTCNPSASCEYYEGKLGLTLVSDEPYALVFDLNGHTLRIAKVSESAAVEHTVLGWQVNDISAVVTSLVSRGVVFESYESLNQDELGIWASPSGAKVAWFKDPDGNTLSLTQRHGDST